MANIIAVTTADKSLFVAKSCELSPPMYEKLFKISDVEEKTTQIARFMGPTWGPPGSCRPQMGPMLAPWTLLSGEFVVSIVAADGAASWDRQNDDDKAHHSGLWAQLIMRRESHWHSPCPEWSLCPVSAFEGSTHWDLNAHGHRWPPMFSYAFLWNYIYIYIYIVCVCVWSHLLVDKFH